MTDSALSRTGEVEEVPVPLVAAFPGDQEAEQPVALTDTVGEREDNLEGAPEKPENDPGSQIHDDPEPADPVMPAVRGAADADGRHRRVLTAALVALACVGAFAHGWHVGSEALGSAASRPGADVVNHITYQEEEDR